jgi:Trypsin
MIVHPNYNKDNLTSDLAIIFFSRDAVLNNKVSVVCLWNYDNSLEKLVNQVGTVSVTAINLSQNSLRPACSGSRLGFDGHTSQCGYKHSAKSKISRALI